MSRLISLLFALSFWTPVWFMLGLESAVTHQVGLLAISSISIFVGLGFLTQSLLLHMRNNGKPLVLPARYTVEDADSYEARLAAVFMLGLLNTALQNSTALLVISFVLAFLVYSNSSFNNPVNLPLMLFGWNHFLLVSPEYTCILLTKRTIVDPAQVRIVVPLTTLVCIEAED